MGYLMQDYFISGKVRLNTSTLAAEMVVQSPCPTPLYGADYFGSRFPE